MSELSSWRKSSYSGPQGNCVEVGAEEGTVGVRDTKNPRHILVFNHNAWTGFVNAIKAQRLTT